jgi:acyl-[acyl-carrier-protein]-phospholipid O-acyltransferase/long-chain-fatty-acid--[acyl-carrier-protein] ligase
MVSLFWTFGIIALSLLPPLIKLRLGGDEMAVSGFLALFAVAVALGSGLGSFLCRDGIKLGSAPLATFLIGLGAADLAWALIGSEPPAVWRVGADLAVMAAAGGVLAVPSFSAAQAWAPVEKRARVVAAINVLNAAFMVAGTLAVALLQGAGLDLAGVFALLAVVCWASAAWMFKNLPPDPAAID